MLSLALCMDLVRLELDGHIQGVEDVLDTSRDLRPDAIARKEHDLLLVAVGQPSDNLESPHKLISDRIIW